jgi:hypothetical protein
MEKRSALDQLQKVPPLSASDEERFLVPDKLSELSLEEAIEALTKQYLLCKKSRLPPNCPQWLLWTATFMRSWIARIQAEPDSPYLFSRKAFFVLWWVKGAALEHFSKPNHIAHQKKAKGIAKDAATLIGHIEGLRELTAPQKEWVEKSFRTLLPLVKRQILSTIPPKKQEDVTS